MKYALLVGIGYVNTRHALEGPLRDVYKIKETLVDYECTIITDHTQLLPTKKLIVEAFLELLQKKGPLFFYYSGHGQEEGIFCADQEILTHDEFRKMLETMTIRQPWLRYWIRVLAETCLTLRINGPVNGTKSAQILLDMSFLSVVHKKMN